MFSLSWQAHDRPACAPLFALAPNENSNQHFPMLRTRTHALRTQLCPLINFKGYIKLNHNDII